MKSLRFAFVAACLAASVIGWPLVDPPAPQTWGKKEANGGVEGTPVYLNAEEGAFYTSADFRGGSLTELKVPSNGAVTLRFPRLDASVVKLRASLRLESEETAKVKTLTQPEPGEPWTPNNLVMVIPAGKSGQITVTALGKDDAELPGSVVLGVSSEEKKRQEQRVGERPGRLIASLGAGYTIGLAYSGEVSKIGLTYPDGTAVQSNGQNVYRIVRNESDVNSLDGQIAVHYLLPDNLFGRDTVLNRLLVPRHGRVGLSFGSAGVGTDSRRYLAGVSYFPDDSYSFAITAGIFYQNQTILTNGYNVGDTVIGESAYSIRRLRPGFFIGFTYSGVVGVGNRSGATNDKD